MSQNTANSRSNPPRINWRISTRAQQGQGIYALALISVDRASSTLPSVTSNKQFPSYAGASQPTPAITEFHFPMTPKSLALEEPAAVQIVPTQNRGQFIEHQGNIYKNIQVGGTTGLRPNAASSNLLPFFGVSNPFSSETVDPDTFLPTGERTGFDDLLELRNLFRAYFDAKADPKRAPTTLMVWQNGKEGDYYVVEPITFRTTRDAGSPLTFNYEFTLKTIERLDVSSVFRLDDSYTEANNFNTFIGRLNRVTQKLTQAFTLASSLIDRTASIGKATVTSVLGPVNAILTGLTNVTNAVARTLDIPRTTVASVAGSATDLAEALDKAVSNAAYIDNGISTQFTAAANAYRNIGRTLRALHAEDQLFASSYASAISSKARAYNDSLTGTPNSGGSVLDLNNAVSTNSAGEAAIFDNEDIRMLAKRLLGDSGRWKELVVLNNLKPPYISASGDGINVLRPHQLILYPRAGAASPAPIASANKARFVGITSLDERLGTDMRLVANEAAGGIVSYDLAVGPTGDIDLVSGVDNLGQAVTIKFSTEPGELPTHPLFGAFLPIGTKAKISSLIALQIGARATLLSDRRIQDVSSVNVNLTGNTVKLTASASVRDDDQVLPLDFSVRR